MNVLPIWKVSTQEIESAPLEETKEMALEHQETVSLETSVCMKVYNELLPTVTFEHTCRHTTVTRVPIQDAQRCLDFILLILIYQKKTVILFQPQTDLWLSEFGMQATTQPSLLFSLQLQFLKGKSLSC